MEHTFHRLPFLCGSRSGSHKLENRHIIFPFLLAGQSGKPFHCRVPIKIECSLDYHKQTCIQNVNFHFKDTDFPDTGDNFRPDFRLAVASAILGYQLRIVTQIQCPSISFHRLMMLFSRITFNRCFHGFIFICPFK